MKSSSVSVNVLSAFSQSCWYPLPGCDVTSSVPAMFQPELISVSLVGGLSGNMSLNQFGTPSGVGGFCLDKTTLPSVLSRVMPW